MKKRDCVNVAEDDRPVHLEQKKPSKSLLTFVAFLHRGLCFSWPSRAHTQGRKKTTVGRRFKGNVRSRFACRRTRALLSYKADMLDLTNLHLNTKCRMNVRGTKSKRFLFMKSIRALRRKRSSFIFLRASLELKRSMYEVCVCVCAHV